MNKQFTFIISEVSLETYGYQRVQRKKAILVADTYEKALELTHGLVIMKGMEVTKIEAYYSDIQERNVWTVFTISDTFANYIIEEFEVQK